MTFRIPDAGDLVAFYSPGIAGPYPAIVRRLAIDDNELAADMVVDFGSGEPREFDAVRYHDATPDPNRPGMYFEFLDEDAG